MVDFENETRKQCRHCRMRLPEPVANEREAFCVSGCYRSFYRHRCRVCEQAIEQTRGLRVVCNRSKCKATWKGGEGFGKMPEDARTSPPSKNAETVQVRAVDALLFEASDAIHQVNTAYADRPWRMVAGSLTANQYHCAVVGTPRTRMAAYRISGMRRFGLAAMGVR